MSQERQAGRGDERLQSTQRGRRGRTNSSNRMVEDGWNQVLDRLDSRLLRRARLAIKQNEIGPALVRDGRVRAPVRRKGPDRRGMEVSLPLVAEWEPLQRSVATWFVQRPDWLAALLAGEWEDDFLSFLEGNGLRLFPSSDTVEPWLSKAHCGCDDWETPCRHVAALIIQMATEIEESPRALFRFVGLSLEWVLNETKRLASDGASLSTTRTTSMTGAEQRDITPQATWDALSMVLGEMPIAVSERGAGNKGKASTVVPTLDRSRLLDLCNRYLRVT
jgi:uncharacterized Zn finger protein